MSTAALLSLALRGSLILALALVPLPFLRRSSASHRRLALLLGVLAALCLPLGLAWPERPFAVIGPAPEVVRVVSEALSAPPNASAVSGPVALEAASKTSPPWDGLVLLVWALGAAFFAGRFALASLRAQRLARRASVANGVGHSAELSAPAVVGLWRPVILLPPSAHTWSSERRRAVLLHERAHVDGRDGLVLAAAQLCVALYWFQPLAWFVRKALRRECELRADEAALAGGLRATSYAEHLLAVARLAAAPPAGIAMAARPSELGHRIAVLLARTAPPAALSRKAALFACSSALLAFSAVACAAFSDQKAAPRPQQASKLGGSNPQLQRIVEAEARQLRAEWGGDRVAVVVLAAATAEILALSDDEPGAPVVPASTLKPFVMAAALDAGKIEVGQRFDCGQGERDYNGTVLRDAGKYGSLDSAEMLAVSSNVGLSRVFDALGGEGFQSGLARFHLKAPRVEAGTIEGAITAIGQKNVQASPLQLAAGYAVFANDGVYRAPQTSGAAGAGERVIRAETARSIRSMLEVAVAGERATGRGAQLAGVSVAGKTGTSVSTAGTFANFVGIVPAHAPRFVIYVGVRNPQREGTGASVSAPAFARIARQMLAQRN